MAAAHNQGIGAKQADGTNRVEPTIDVQYVADTVVHIAGMPPHVSMLYVNVM